MWETKVDEEKAILLGLQLAKEYGYDDVVVESDCLTVANAIQKNEEGWSHFHLIVDYITHDSKAFSSILFSFVSKGSNKVVMSLQIT